MGVGSIRSPARNAWLVWPPWMPLGLCGCMGRRLRFPGAIIKRGVVLVGAVLAGGAALRLGGGEEVGEHHARLGDLVLGHEQRAPRARRPVAQDLAVRRDGVRADDRVEALAFQRALPHRGGHRVGHRAHVGERDPLEGGFAARLGRRVGRVHEGDPAVPAGHDAGFERGAALRADGHGLQSRDPGTARPPRAQDLQPARAMDDLRRDPMSRYDLRDISEKLSGSKDSTAVVTSFLSYLQAVRRDWKASLAFYECSTDRLVSIYSVDGTRLQSAELDLSVEQLPPKRVRKLFHHSAYFADFNKRTLLSLIFQNSPFYRAEKTEASSLAPITALNAWESCLCMPLADSEDIIALLVICSAK